MDFKTLQIPVNLIASWYHNSLISESSDKNPGAGIDASKPQAPILFLGKNIRRFVILVNYPDEVNLPAPALDFLSNILKACGMNLADVAIVNVVHCTNLTYEVLASQLQPKQVVVFGQDAQLVFSNDSVVFERQNTPVSGLVAPSLELLNGEDKDSKLLKSRLWLSMKSLLDLK